MAKIFTFALLSFILICILCACRGGGEGGSSTSTNPSTKYLAKNIVFDSNGSESSVAIAKKNHSSVIDFVKSAYAQSDYIDTETKIMAKNVVFENSSASEIESDNVQDALEEITMLLPRVMIGRWEIKNYDNDDNHRPTGLVEIYDDGTFNLIEGSFAAIGMGSSEFCSHTEENQTYEVLTNELIRFTHYNDTAKNSVIPLLLKLRQDEIIFMGMGGCGVVSDARYSILSKVIK